MTRKFCAFCGKPLEEQALVCVHCGSPVVTAQPQQPPVYPQQPYGQAPSPQQPYIQPVYVQRPPVPGRGFGITSLVLGIIAMVYAWGMTIASVSITALEFGQEAALFLVIEGVFLSVFGILATVFGFSAIKKGYCNNISKAGRILGLISTSVYALIVLIGVFTLATA